MTPPQFRLAVAHLHAAHRLADDTAGLFPDRAGVLRDAAEGALIDAAIAWRAGCTLSFEAFAGYRIRGALAVLTEGWTTEDQS